MEQHPDVIPPDARAGSRATPAMGHPHQRPISQAPARTKFGRNQARDIRGEGEGQWRMG